MERLETALDTKKLEVLVCVCVWGGGGARGGGGTTPGGGQVRDRQGLSSGCLLVFWSWEPAVLFPTV
jgi:hypothetical protein